jgi:hypothetical protein
MPSTDLTYLSLAPEVAQPSFLAVPGAKTGLYSKRSQFSPYLDKGMKVAWPKVWLTPLKCIVDQAFVGLARYHLLHPQSH